MYLRFECFRVHQSGKPDLDAGSGIHCSGVGQRCAGNYSGSRCGLERELQGFGKCATATEPVCAGCQRGVVVCSQRQPLGCFEGERAILIGPRKGATHSSASGTAHRKCALGAGVIHGLVEDNRNGAAIGRCFGAQDFWSGCTKDPCVISLHFCSGQLQAAAGTERSDCRGADGGAVALPARKAGCRGEDKDAGALPLATAGHGRLQLQRVGQRAYGGGCSQRHHWPVEHHSDRGPHIHCLCIGQREHLGHLHIPGGVHKETEVGGQLRTAGAACAGQQAHPNAGCVRRCARRHIACHTRLRPQQLSRQRRVKAQRLRHALLVHRLVKIQLDGAITGKLGAALRRVANYSRGAGGCGSWRYGGSSWRAGSGHSRKQKTNAHLARKVSAHAADVAHSPFA